jgi:hypothetical protein
MKTSQLFVSAAMRSPRWWVVPCVLMALAVTFGPGPLTAQGPAICASGNLVVSVSGDHVFFVGVDQRIYNYWYSSTGWQLDALDYNAPAIAAGDLVVNSKGDHVFFVGVDQRVYNYWWNSAKAGNTKWQLDWLGPAQIAGGNLVLNSLEDHVFFVGVDQRIYNYWYTSTGWQLDALDYSAPAIALGNLVFNAAKDHLFFLGTDARVYNFWWNPAKAGSSKWQLDWLGPAQIAGL